MNAGNTLEVYTNKMSEVFGELDANIKKVEKTFSVGVINRENCIKITGEEKDVEKAVKVIKSLIAIAEKGELITSQNVDYLLATVEEEEFDKVETIYDDSIVITVTGRPIKPKTLGQKKYHNLIKKNTIVFGIGPAGTGKTFLAMANAVSAFKTGDVSRIILTRPAIEAGEKLGFLPGDLQQKVDPYIRPLYDALYEIMGLETAMKHIEKNAIEVAPLAYMRGRTLDNSFIILDEAQNTTAEQMKMFLTRIGFGSKVVVTGDITQIDLPFGKSSGLVEAAKILHSIEDIGIITLTNKDVVRHPLVQKIIAAYERHEKRSFKK